MAKQVRQDFMERPRRNLRDISAIARAYAQRPCVVAGMPDSASPMSKLAFDLACLNAEENPDGEFIDGPDLEP